MRIPRVEYEHATQASRVRLNAFELPPPSEQASGAALRQGRYLVTEQRRRAVTAVATRGRFDTREAALADVRRRGQELKGQRFRRVAPAA